MKALVLQNVHLNLGAKMVNYAGFQMPVQYKGVLLEHQNVREKVGIFDVSHMGEFLISGKNALDLVQKITSNDAEKLNIGKAQYSYLPNENGGIIDDLIVYKLKEKKYMLVVNAANIEKNGAWIQKQNTKIKADLKNVSEEYCLFAVQGPKSLETLQPLTEIDLSKIPFYEFKIGTFANCPNIIISNTGYTGSGGFEIYCKKQYAKTIWEKILEQGKKFEIMPIGLAARDTLRLEMGYCLYGNDIHENTCPLEAGLGWVTKFNKHFIGKKLLQEKQKNGLTKKLVGFEMMEKGIPRKDYKIFDKEKKEIGNVTSGTIAPTLKKAIGMGYVMIHHAFENNEIFIEIRTKILRAKIVKMPFYKCTN